ncbi:MAG: hypothetical protein KDH88_08715 [Chromatiales bacterium]|nr:hypothetical protein [Chromatiales bacterium]
MTISRAEFLRLLPCAAVGYRLEENASGIRLVAEDGAIVIRLATLDDLRIGSLSLPRMRIAIHFENIAAPSRTAFLQRFDRSFQRGGG